MAEIPGLRVPIEIDTSGITVGVSKVKEGLSSIAEESVKTASKLGELKSIMIGVFGGNLLTSGLMGFEKTLEELNLAVQDAQVESLRLSTALKNTGNASEANSKLVEKTVQSYTELGFTNAQASQSMGTLITATGNVSESTQLMAMAADLARYKHEDLNTAATTLARGTQGSVKAFKELGITLDSHLPKNQAIAKAFEQLNGKIGGQAVAYTHTFAGEIASLKERFNEVAVKVGNVLFPIVTKLIAIFIDATKIVGQFYKAAIEPLVNFVIKNKSAFEIFFGVLAVGFAAFKTYEIVTKAVLIAQEAWYVATLLMKGVEIAQIAVTEGLTGAMVALDTAMTILTAPITLIVLGIAALATGFVIAWNHSKTFRDVMTNAMEVGVKGVGLLIKTFGLLVTGLMNVVTGPLQLLLKGLSLLGVSAAGDALKGIQSGIKGVGDFFDNAQKKVNNFADGLDKLKNKKISIPNFFGGGDSKTLPDTGSFNITGDVPGGDLIPGGGGGGGKGKGKTAAEKLAEKLAKDKATVQKIYGEMKTDIARYYAEVEKLQYDWQISSDSAYEEFYKRNKDAQQAYNDTLFNLQRSHDNAMDDANRHYKEALADEQQRADNSTFDANRSFNQAMATANEAYKDSIAKAEQAHVDTLATITETYNQAVLDANTSNQEKILELQKANNEAIAQLQQRASDKQLSIIQKSKYLLIKAFEGVTTINLSNTFFGGGGTATGLVSNLKRHLDEAHKLQQDASALAGKGYTQTFIQEVIKQGPYVGDQMAKSILNATPETAAQIQALYGQVQDVSQNGMNALADQMNSGANLATKALTDEYNQVAIELAQSLADQANKFQESLAKQQIAYQTALDKALDAQNKSIVASDKTLTDALGNAKEALDKSTASASQTLSNSLFDTNRTLIQAQANAKRTLDDALADENRTLKQGISDADETLKRALADSQDTLGKALLAAQATYDTAIQALNDATMTKITKLQTQLKTVADLISGIQGKSAGVGVLAGSPGAGYIAGTKTLTAPSFTPDVLPGPSAGGVSIDKLQVFMDDPSLARITTGLLAAQALGQTQGLTPSKGINTESYAWQR